MEQRNWLVIRRLIGYDHYSTKAAYEQLEKVCQRISLHHNFFQPLSKLVSKHREGGKVCKKYDRAQMPYQRLLASGILKPEKKEELRRRYESLNPAQLRREIEVALTALWKTRDAVKGGDGRRIASDHDEEASGEVDSLRAAHLSTGPTENGYGNAPSEATNTIR